MVSFTVLVILLAEITGVKPIELRNEHFANAHRIPNQSGQVIE